MKVDNQPAMPLPWWGWLILLPGMAGSLFLLSMVGGAALETASWEQGMLWGFFAFFCLGGVFLLSRLADPQWALCLAIFAFVVISLGGQAEFFALARERLERQVREDDTGRFPENWKALDREALYRAWMADTLKEPAARGWWFHLRAQARAGISHFERATEFVEGQSGYRPVYRQGWRVWLNWISIHFFAGVGCVFGLVGSAVWCTRVQDEMRARRFAETFEKTAVQAMMDHGATKEQAQDVMRHAYKKDRRKDPIRSEDVRRMLPASSEEVINAITEDLDLARQWSLEWRMKHSLKDEQSERLRRFLRDHYYLSARPEENLKPYHLVLVAGSRLHEAEAGVGRTLYQGLLAVHEILRVYEVGVQVPPFDFFDFTGLSFQSPARGEEWEPLITGGQTYYGFSAAWEKLEKLAPEAIPEDAYLAIIHQYMNGTDPRNHEYWAGVYPSEVVERLGLRLRDAMLTYLFMVMEGRFSYPTTYLQHVPLMAGRWPYDVAEPILRRCVEIGWRSSLKAVPDTAEWQAFLDGYAYTPFGEGGQLVDWWSKRRLRRERGLE